MSVKYSSRSGGIMGISFRFFLNMKECCVFSLESPHYVSPPKVRGDILVWVRIMLVSALGLVSASAWQICAHNISWISWWNSTKLIWIYHWDKLKSWLGFGDLVFIFKVTVGFRWQFLVPKISLEPGDGIPPNLPGYIIGSSLRAGYVLVTLTSFSRSQEDWDI